MAAYTFDFRCGELDWSPSVFALYGFDRSGRPTVERWLDAVHPDDRAAVQAVAEGALKHGHDVDHRFRIVRSDGSTAWIQDRGRIHLGRDGAPERLVGINVDVTELVELEQRASENEERLRLAMQAEQIAAWDWTMATDEVRWDEALAQLSGVGDGFTRKFDSFWELVADEDRERVRTALDDALAGRRPYALEFRMRRPDGSIRWTHTRAVVVRDAAGKALRMVGVDADITERKAGEAALRANDRFLHSVLDARTDCIKVLELDGTLSYMNRNGQCAMEVSDIDRLKGRPWEQLWPEPGASHVRNAIEKAGRGESSNFGAFCPTAAGTPKWWDVSVSPIVDDDGAPTRIVSISRDITDRRASDDQLKLFNAELHHRIKNNLATVQAMARATLRSTPDVVTFERDFSDRLSALASTYELLRAGSDAATLAELARRELKPYDTGLQQIVVEGPNVVLPADRAIAVGMMLHELTTNACKYGCLSVGGGGLDLRWEIDPSPDRSLLRVEWIEQGGPPVERPTRSGFGSTMIDRLVRQQRGTVSRDWTSAGLHLRLTLPLS